MGFPTQHQVLEEAGRQGGQEGHGHTGAEVWVFCLLGISSSDFTINGKTVIGCGIEMDLAANTRVNSLYQEEKSLLYRLGLIENLNRVKKKKNSGFDH